ncbi:molybdenum cofactor synthesis domain-containing protein [Idiomarina seosinensis]|uniref:Molybdenum cofactor biosynthesis protein B n=1 Tax=Idiomarina seosinensis TaxID=281739 RepID=A0A432ZDR7_9GAMM|nr:molybdenum cofactor synthesis domain-containing protein [Idiomarina seosinensis]RUO76113.1 molybdenum cofactor biosynthesis protein [Idiomarina seosinensis]
MAANKSFKALNIAVLTFSDKRDSSNDSTGDAIQQWAEQAGHNVAHREVIVHNQHLIRAAVCQLIAADEIDVVLTNGGTGFAPDNVTQAAIEPLLDAKVDGFGELFRMLSYEDIGSSSLQSRAFAGITNRTFIAAVPGSGGAAQLAWNQLLKPQLDSRQGPCNFVGHLLKGGA